MAILLVRRSFVSTHGTEVIRSDRFEVEVAIEGALGDEFVRDVDFDSLRVELSDVLRGLEGRYLDDIVGRATIENMAAHVLFELRRWDLLHVEVSQGEAVRVTAQDLDLEGFAALRHARVGVSLAVRGRCEEAIIAFTNALALDSTFAAAHNARGRCHKRLKRHAQSLEDFSAAIALFPSFGEAFRNRGNAYYELGRDDLMMADFDRAVALLPASALAYNNRGFARQRLGQFALAVSDHTRALELEARYAEALLDRGAAYASLGETDLAEVDRRAADTITSDRSAADLERSKLPLFACQRTLTRRRGP